MRKTILILIIASIFACKGGNSPEEKAVLAQTKIYEANPTDSTAQALLNALNKYIEIHGVKDSTSAPYVLQAARVSADHSHWNQALGFYKLYMIQYPGRPDQADRLVDVINIMDTIQNPSLNQVLYRAFADRFNDDPRVASYRDKIEKKEIGLDSLLNSLYLTAFNDSTFRLNEKLSRQYVDAVEAAVMARPDLPKAPEYLSVAAEISRTLRDITKAINLYDWVIEQYPSHRLAATALFLKGFIFDNDLKDFENARKYYEEFLKQHPNNEYADDTRFLLDNLGKSDEELQKIIEQKAKENN